MRTRSKFFYRVLFLAAVLAPVQCVWCQALTLSPAEPKIGAQIAVSYDESVTGAAIKGGNPLVLEAMLMRSNAPSLLKEILLKRDGNVWVGGFLLDDELSLLILFRVVSGDLKDDNGGRPWSLLVYGKDGKAFEGRACQ